MDQECADREVVEITCDFPPPKQPPLFLGQPLGPPFPGERHFSEFLVSGTIAGVSRFLESRTSFLELESLFSSLETFSETEPYP